MAKVVAAIANESSGSRNMKRFTTEYVDGEDRLRLAVELDNGHAVAIWLTQRLLGRLIPVLLKALEPQQTTPRAEILQGWGQHAARAGTTAQPPVPTSGASAWLAHAIDIIASPQGVVLTFRGDASQRTELPLPAVPLRQWLNILYDAYVKAAWPLGSWPDWIREAAPPLGPQAVVLH